MRIRLNVKIRIGAENMSIKLILIICVIFTLNEAYALAFEENIHVNGGGQLVCRTDTQVAKDWIDASGSQSYSRVVNLNTENKTASLRSIYSLNKSNGIKFNITSQNNASANSTQGKTKLGHPIANNSNESENNTLKYTTTNNISQNKVRQEDTKRNIKGQLAANISDNEALDYDYLPIYSRSFRIKNSTSNVFDLIYNNSEDLSRNQYGIRMRNPNNLEHGAVVSGADHFSANNSISFGGDRVITKYKMDGSGLLKGFVIESDTMRRPHYIAETQIRDSNFTISSGVENEAKLEKNLEDRESLSEKVDKVVAGSKKEKEAGQKADIYDKYVGEKIFGDLNLSGAEVPATFSLFGDDGTIDTTNAEDYGYYQQNDAKDNQNDKISSQADDNQKGSVAQVNQTDAKVNQTESDLVAAGARADQSNERASQFDGNHKKAGAQADQSSEKVSQDNSTLKNETKTSNLLKLGSSIENTLGGTIIPGSAFGATINSTYKSPNSMITASLWRRAYIGSYKPDSTKEKSLPGGKKFNVSLVKGIYIITENKTGLKQRYLKIGSSDGPIKIRATPPGARFDIYEANVD
jgi:hypothetical protein